jgi:endonuclease/exonuclease/phosphatase family metal-dependent hydrolase
MNAPRKTRPRLVVGIMIAALIATFSVGVGLATTAEAISLPTPTGLRVVATSANSVAFTWNAVKGAPAYRVQFSTKANMASSKTIDVVGNYMEWSYLDQDKDAASKRLHPGTNYYFRVRVIKQILISSNKKPSLSAYSKRLTARTAPASALPYLAPVRLAATARTSTSMYLSWSSRGPGVDYQVRYLADGADESAAQYRTFPAAGGVLDGLTPGTGYRFWVAVAQRGSGRVWSSQSTPTSFTTPTTDRTPPITVATYNVCSWASSCNKYEGWSTRLTKIANALSAQNPDVIALEEATRGADLIDRLNSRGTRSYRLVGGRSSTDLAYDTNTFTAENTGISSIGDGRSVAWAILTDRRDGRRIFVAATHLINQDSKKAQRKAEVGRLIRVVAAMNPAGLPVLIAGDFNSSKSKSDHRAIYQQMIDAGYLDPFANPTSSRYVGTRGLAEHRINAEYNSANKYKAKASWGKFANGYDVDYIWYTPSLRAAMAGKVLDLDRNGKFVPKPPSDHNMVVASFHQK